jgi:hypothetical protein
MRLVPGDFELIFGSFLFLYKNNNNRKLDWFDDENLVKADKWNKVCILKHMFTLQELEADPTLLLDLKEDIREECEKVGEVTNVIIYDVRISIALELFMFVAIGHDLLLIHVLEFCHSPLLFLYLFS